MNRQIRAYHKAIRRQILELAADVGYGATVDTAARGWAGLDKVGCEKENVSEWLRYLADQIEFDNYQCPECRSFNPNRHELGCESSPAGPKRQYTPKTFSHKLGYLVEECGEVMAAVGKTFRWGLYSTNPELRPETNREWILRELGDLEHAIAFVRDADAMNATRAPLDTGDDHE